MVLYPSNGTLPRPWLSRLGNPKPIIRTRNTWLLEGYRQIGRGSYVLLTIFRMAALVAHRFNLIISAFNQRPRKAGKNRDDQDASTTSLFCDHINASCCDRSRKMRTRGVGCSDRTPAINVRGRRY